MPISVQNKSALQAIIGSLVSEVRPSLKLLPYAKYQKSKVEG
jgi:hypothetical protein